MEELRREVAGGTRGGEVRARISGYILQIMEDSLAYRAHAPADGTRSADHFDTGNFHSRFVDPYPVGYEIICRIRNY